MNETRSRAASTVFNGSVVVLGGDVGKTVEACNFTDNSWYYLTDMTQSKSCHSACSMSNKMFVVGGLYKTSSEVYDCCSRLFTLIQIGNINSNMSFFINTKLFVYVSDRHHIFLYDKNQVFTDENNHTCFFACAVRPIM